MPAVTSLQAAENSSEGVLSSSVVISFSTPGGAQRRGPKDLARVFAQRLELGGLVGLAGARRHDQEHGSVVHPA